MSETKKSENQEPSLGGRDDERREGDTFYKGSEPFFAAFTQAQVVINGLRMTFDEKVAQPVSDLATQVESIRRKFLHDGDIANTIEHIKKVIAKLDQRIQAWEVEAQKREKNKTRMSGENIHKMKAEFTRVRGSSRLSRRMLTKLLTELHQLSSGALSLEDLGGKLPSSTPSAEEVEAAQKKRRESIEIANPILSGLFNDELSLHAATARFSAGTYPKGKEEAWDPKLAAFLVVGWYVSLRTHRSGNNLDLDVWLIPKEPAVSTALALLAPEIQVALRAPGKLAQPLEFFALTAAADVLPRSEQLANFVGMIKQNNFAATQLSLKVLKARLPFAAKEDSFQRLDFKPLK